MPIMAATALSSENCQIHHYGTFTKSSRPDCSVASVGPSVKESGAPRAAQQLLQLNHSPESS